MELLKATIKPTQTSGIFHDTRQDVHTLSKYCIMLKLKLNESIKAYNELEQKLNELEQTIKANKT